MAIELIRFVKRHLNVKVFIITLFIQILIGVVTYTFISIVTPKTYLDKINQTTDALVQSAINRFSELNLAECKQRLLELVMGNNLMIKLTDDKGNEIDFGSDIQFDSDYADQNRLMKEYTEKGYTFKPKDSNKNYFVYIVGNGQRVNLFRDTLQDVIPYLAIIVVVISFVVSLLCSRFISNPVIKISQAAKNLADLKFVSLNRTGRQDEIGIIEESLCELSEHLSHALNELQNKNNELKQEVENVKRMERQQFSFFSAVSHELKTPITALKGQLQGMIHNVGGYKDHNKYLNRALAIVQDMESLVVEIMSSAKIHSDSFVPQKQEIELRRMVSDVINEYEDIAMSKEVFLQINLGEEDIYVLGDDSLLRIAISNILSNAIRYSVPETDIFVCLQMKKQYILFYIINQCEHIPESEIDRMFLPFTRLEESRNRATGGSGLGLYLVKMILDMHEVQYKLYNIPKGVKFEIHFDLAHKSDSSH